jgi:hypothetical protein
MEGVDTKSFEFALSKIEDGFLFESFAHDYLSKILGYTFIPVGGMKDRGIDGLEHVFCRDGYQRYVYQASIEKTCESKLQHTLQKLEENKVKFDQLYFVTNQVFLNKDVTIDLLYEKYHKPIHIYDLNWLSSKVNNSPSTINCYQTFISSYLHEFSKPGKSYVVGNLVTDPRLYVFLRQQWEDNRKYLELDEILADTLILYSLEGTDPDKKILMTRQEIKERITQYIKFDPKLLSNVIDKRLNQLSIKPRRIKYHKSEKGYCLPYETRLMIQDRNIKDQSLYEQFKIGVDSKLKTYLKDADIRVKDCEVLIETTINRLFYQQGLEFADFVLHGQNQQAVEKNLPDIIGYVVDESNVVLKNKQQVKAALLITIREIVYNGSKEQKEFLKRLSNTYMMLFLLQCDPKLATYFHTMASKLNVYVCTSIIIPALSEFFLDPVNRRHWNLLKGSYEAGVTLVVNETIMDELVSHFRMIINKYEYHYKNNENLYLVGDIEALYVDEIMIRAYFYAKRRNQVSKFSDFIDNFVNPNLENAHKQLVDWLKEEFGIRYKSDRSLGVKLDPDEVTRLSSRLKSHKSSVMTAQTDSRLILTIYALRELNNETGSSSIFGYKTWWLSKDTATQKDVNKEFINKYKVSCYIRPDFLYNYISLAPTKSEVDATYRELFPSLVGVNISSNLPREITTLVHDCIDEHRMKNPVRLNAILGDLSQKLQIDPRKRNRQFVKHFLDEQLKNLGTNS